MNVYLIKVATLNNTTNKFEFYRDEVFSSERKLLRAVDNMIDCNNGYNVTKDEMDFGSYKEKYVTYGCMSAPCEDGVCQAIRVRYVLRKIKVQ